MTQEDPDLTLVQELKVGEDQASFVVYMTQHETK